MATQKRPRIAVVVLATLVLAACGGGDEDTPNAPVTTVTRQAPATEPAATEPAATEPSRPGDPEVYARIAKLTDCAKLQEQFNLAEATSQRPGGPAGATWSEIGIAYMQAADERMNKLGCYG